MSTSVSPGVGRLAIVVGLVAIGSMISVVTFFAIAGGPFGAINDIGNGILAALSATAPAWIWLGYLGWFGIYLLYPAWAIWFGRWVVTSVRRSQTRAATGG